LSPLLVKRDTSKTKKAKFTEKDLQNMSKTNFKFVINLDAKKFLFRKLNANNVSAKINYDNSIISIPKLKFNTCKGTIEANASLHEFSYLKADINVTNADVKQLFMECEEFGQKAITSDNILGDLDAKMDLTAVFTDNFELEPGSLTGKAEIKLKNGHLLNYEPLQNISHFLFRNRNFEDITFSEINETFYIQDNKMQINELEIASSVLNMYIEGIYDFKGESNINMRIPWSNLKRRGKNYIPKSLGEEGKNAKGLKLNYHGQPNKLKLRLGNH
ncbi:MAG TPA: AsmA-like C-terminal region-containing protein, partial [Nitrosopumilaceae archaeon]|nr:AsmA-like C-terminal region-containing protein [Nitrosopumilaceae archaeon]